VVSTEAFGCPENNKNSVSYFISDAPYRCSTYYVTSSWYYITVNAAYLYYCMGAYTLSVVRRL